MRMFVKFVMLSLIAMIGLIPPTLAQSGLLKKKTKLDPITLSAGKPLAEKPYELEAGKYYSLQIKADGSQELGIAGPEFFRNMWVNEIVVNDVEIRPLGVDSLEFDGAGEATISFIPIRPGSFILQIPKTTGETQRAVFNVKG
ncbi:MAG: hypothetical protein JNM89_09825 [Hyphomicrobiaceae bacterium]|nr:hypothetical protein [Hyphomicrobiaceae bacterium]